ncbi:TPA: hypothetical protein ACN306_004754 [Vibrio parahaemolyticus]|nr:hypothetical protein [Vibrio parahaemolyticus]
MGIMTRKLFGGLLLVLLSGYAFMFLPHFFYDDIWGDDPDEPYIAIKGRKPVDATAKARGAFWVTGDECESYSYDLFGRKAHRGGKIDRKYTQDFSSDPNFYELRIPYKSVVDSSHCIIELRDISVSFENDFSGFGLLRIYQPMEHIYKYALPTDSVLEAKDCNAVISKLLDEWSGRNRCVHYVNGKKNGSSNPENVNFDFTKFSGDTVIRYDVYAGKHYRSEPLDPVAGP